MKKAVFYSLALVLIILTIPLLSFFGEGKIHIDEKPSKRIYLVRDVKTNEILKLTPKEYIVGVVSAEMPVSFHEEALKAQAVAAHSYALLQIGQGAENQNGAMLSTDSAVYQAYLSNEELKTRWGDDYEANIKKVASAVGEVINEIMVKDGAPIAAAFHSISGGRTESAKNIWGEELSYLSPVKSEGDLLSPEYEKEIILSPEEVSFAVKKEYPDVSFTEDYNSWFEIKERSDSGTVIEMKICDLTLSGKELRSLLKLRSANFEISFENGAFKIVTYGYGHGVGMSQYGADFMARQGKSYKEILEHYYKGAEIVRVAEE